MKRNNLEISYHQPIDDGGNEDGKKAIGLDKQNNNSARASCFFVNFVPVVARPQRESA